MGLTALLVPLLVRATSELSLFPGWDTDPLLSPLPFTGLGPAESMVIDLTSLVGASLLLFDQFIRRRPLAWPLLLLAALGAIPIVAHGWLLGPHRGSLGDQRIGLSWVSAIFGALAAYHACRDQRTRRVVVSVLLGLIALLAVRGLQQVLIEHPQTIADFRANREAYLAAHGWTPDSPMAKSFERRLLQPEATGWLGLSNVYASFAAAALVAFVCVLAAARRAGPRALAAPALGLVLSAVALFAALSKGGIIAAAFGLSAALALFLFRNRPILRTCSGLAAILAPLALVVIRGLIGERLGELSLLFRWFYMQAATRIFAAHPLAGVGPDGFQQAYLTAKNPLSPEDVVSPHSILFDYFATLGIFGAAWCSLVIAAAFDIARRAAPTGEPPLPSVSEAAIHRTESRIILLIPALATLVAVWLAAPMITPDMALVRIVGLGLWCLLSWGLLRLLASGIDARIPFAAASLTLIAHAQIDVAASWPASCGLVLVFIAAAASPKAPSTGGTGVLLVGLGKVKHLVLLLIPVLIIAIMALNAQRTVTWQHHLIAGAEALRPAAEFQTRMQALASSDPVARSDSLQSIAADLSQFIGAPVSPTPPAIAEALGRLQESRITQALDHLARATAAHPDDWRPRREASRLLLTRAAWFDATARPDRAAADLDLARDVLDLSSPAAMASAPSTQLRWLALVHELRAGRDLSSAHAELAAAAAALELALQRDPYSLDLAFRLMTTFRQLSDPANTRRFALRVLELDDLARLDREVRGLSAEQRQEAVAAAQIP